MQALSDEQQMERLEKKVDDGFAEMRAETKAGRAELTATKAQMGGEIGGLHRLMIQLFVGLFATLIFGFAGIVTAILTNI